MNLNANVSKKQNTKNSNRTIIDIYKEDSMLVLLFTSSQQFDKDPRILSNL